MLHDCALAQSRFPQSAIEVTGIVLDFVTEAAQRQCDIICSDQWERVALDVNRPVTGSPLGHGAVRAFAKEVKSM